MTRARDLADSADKDIVGTVTLDDITLSNDITLADNGKAIFGAGSDLQIYHDGSHSRITDSGTGNLRLRGSNVGIESNAGHEIFTGIEGGAVILYHNNSQVFTTVSTGIDVTGTAVTDGLTVAGNVSVDGGTIKLDGNYPTGTENVALGDAALDDASLTGGYNTAIGTSALTANTGGNFNSALGRDSLKVNTSGSSNVGVGVSALLANTTGATNTAVGVNALAANTTATRNTAVGYQAGYSTTTGSFNTFLGKDAGKNNVSGQANTFLGDEAGWYTTSNNNTFIGDDSGWLVTSGANNTILGRYSGNQGGLDIRTGSNNIVLSDGDGNPRFIINASGNAGLAAVPQAWSARNALQVSNSALAYQSNSANGGSTIASNNFYFNGSDRAILTGYSQGVVMNPSGGGQVKILTTSGTTSAGGVISFTAGPYVTAGGTSWTSSSDERLKTITGEISDGLTKVASLRAAEFTWNDDSNNNPQVGLIAQDVQAVLPEVISQTTKYNSDDETEYLGVAYDQVIPLLVAALKEAKTKIETLEADVAALKNP